MIGRVYQTQWVTYERSYAEKKSYNDAVGMPLAKLWQQYDYCQKKVRHPASCDAILTGKD